MYVCLYVYMCVGVMIILTQIIHTYTHHIISTVIADPPKFAPTRNTLDKAKKKYIQVNEAAMKLVKPGGLLLTHSCSAAVTQQHLLPTFILQG